jgi:hypothetical protein
MYYIRKCQDRRKQSIPINFKERRKRVWDRRENRKGPIPLIVFFVIAFFLFTIGIFASFSEFPSIALIPTILP